MYVVSMSMEPLSSLLHFGKKKKKRRGKNFPKISSCGRKEIKFHIAQQRANNPEQDPVSTPASVLMVPVVLVVSPAQSWFTQVG